MAGITYLDEEPTSGITYLDEEPQKPTSTKISDLSILQKLFLPSTLPHEFMTQQATKGIRMAQQAAGATSVGKAADILTSPHVSPLNLLVRNAMRPEMLGSVVGQAADPLSYLGFKAASSAGEGLASTAQRFPITTASKARALQSIREGFLKAPKIAGNEFEQGLNKLVEQNPSQRVDLSGVVQQLQQAELQTPGIKSSLSRAIRTSKHAGFIESLLNQDPSLSADLTIQEAQAFKRTIQDTLRNKFNQFAPELNDVHLELLDAYHGIRAAQLEAFPEMKDVLSAYGQQLNKFRALKPLFRQGTLSKAIMSDLSKEPEILTMAQQLLPEETLKQLNTYRRTQQVVGGAKVITGGLTIEELLRRLLGR